MVIQDMENVLHAWILGDVSGLSSRVAEKSYFAATVDVVVDSAAGYGLKQSANVVSHDSQCRKAVGRTDRLLCCCVICKFLEACIPKGVDVMIFCVYLSHVTLHRLHQHDLCELQM